MSQLYWMPVPETKDLYRALRTAETRAGWHEDPSCVILPNNDTEVHCVQNGLGSNLYPSRWQADGYGNWRLWWLISCVNLTGLRDGQLHGKMELAILMATVQHWHRKRRDPFAWAIYIWWRQYQIGGARTHFPINGVGTQLTDHMRKQSTPTIYGNGFQMAEDLNVKNTLLRFKSTETTRIQNVSTNLSLQCLLW